MQALQWGVVWDWVWRVGALASQASVSASQAAGSASQAAGSEFVSRQVSASRPASVLVRTPA
jgi:hypothetical protein